MDVGQTVQIKLLMDLKQLFKTNSKKAKRIVEMESRLPNSFLHDFNAYSQTRGEIIWSCATPHDSSFVPKASCFKVKQFFNGDTHCYETVHLDTNIEITPEERREEIENDKIRANDIQIEIKEVRDNE